MDSVEENVFQFISLAVIFLNSCFFNKFCFFNRYGTFLVKNVQNLSIQPQTNVNAARHLSVVHGDLSRLNERVRHYIEDKARLCQPDNLHICDGSESENDYLLNLMLKQGMITPLPKYENW